MKNLFLIAASLTLMAGTAMAQKAAPPAQTFSFSLADCIKYAYEHQDSVKNAQLDVTSAEYKVKETTGIGLPQINGSVSFQDYLKKPEVSIFGQKLSIAQSYNNTVGLDVNQILFDGSYLVGLKASIF